MENNDEELIAPEATKPEPVVVMLDSCYSGGINIARLIHALKLCESAGVAIAKPPSDVDFSLEMEYDITDYLTSWDGLPSVHHDKPYCSDRTYTQRERRGHRTKPSRKRGRKK